MDTGILVQLCGLLVILVFYHVAEYVIHKMHHPKDTEASSFLITVPYLIAFGCGLVEYSIERFFFTCKSDLVSPVFFFGVLCTFFGLYIRFQGIITAGKAFTHLVQYEKREEHKLITHGIYKYIRHPGYLGFFIFAIGTQIALKNPFSVLAFAYVLWKFFDDRIRDEERSLCMMFPVSYKKYRDCTPTYIPFIK